MLTDCCALFVSLTTVVGTATQKVSCSPTAQAQEQGWLWLCKTEWSEKRNSVNPNYPGFKSLESPLIWRENYDFMPTTVKKKRNKSLQEKNVLQNLSVNTKKIIHSMLK